MTAYQITLRESQTVGSWTTDRCGAVTTRKRDAAEAYAARLRDHSGTSPEVGLKAF